MVKNMYVACSNDTMYRYAFLGYDSIIPTNSEGFCPLFANFVSNFAMNHPISSRNYKKKNYFPPMR
jgi:hypothetical protein